MDLRWAYLIVATGFLRVKLDRLEQTKKKESSTNTGDLDQQSECSNHLKQQILGLPPTKNNGLEAFKSKTNIW
jgi:hypothetical protein